VLRTMAADSAIIVLIDIFRLLVRSGVIAALLSTQTPAASEHSINHEPPAMDQRWPQNSAGNGCSFAALHMSACGTKRTCLPRLVEVRFWGAERTWSNDGVKFCESPRSPLSFLIFNRKERHRIFIAHLDALPISANVMDDSPYVRR